MRFLIIHQV